MHKRRFEEGGYRDWLLTLLTKKAMKTKMLIRKQELSSNSINLFLILGRDLMPPPTRKLPASYGCVRAHSLLANSTC